MFYGTDSLGALNASVVITPRNITTLSVTLTGTWIATIAFQGSVDGVTYFSLPGQIPALGTSSASSSINGTYLLSAAGVQFIKLITTSYTSGAVSVAWFGTTAPSMLAQQTAAFGQDPSGDLDPLPAAGVLINNSTSTPLAANGVAIGTWTDVSAYSHLSVLAISNVPSAPQGLIVQHSTDGVNVDASDTRSVAPNVNAKFNFDLPGQYVRVLYTNGTTAQASFRLAAKAHVEAASVQVIGNAHGNKTALLTGYNHLRVGIEPKDMFLDKFDTSINAVNWTTAVLSSGTAASTGGQLVMTAPTANDSAMLTSVNTFEQRGNVFLEFGCNWALEAAPFATNTYRFWGLATTVGGLPFAGPIQNGVGFELRGSVMSAVIYSGGVATYSQVIQAPTDGRLHRYSFFFNTQFTYWYVDSNDVEVAASNGFVPATQILPLKLLLLTDSVAPSPAPIYNNSAIALADRGGNSSAIKDSTYPQRGAAVDEFGHLNVAAQWNYNRMAGDGTTVVKSGTGILHGFLVGNDNQNATYTFYDNTAGSGTIIHVHTTGSPSGGLLSTSGVRGGYSVAPIDLRFTTGLTVVRTGGAATSLTALYR